MSQFSLDRQFVKAVKSGSVVHITRRQNRYSSSADYYAYVADMDSPTGVSSIAGTFSKTLAFRVVEKYSIPMKFMTY